MAEYSGQMQKCVGFRLLCVFVFCVCISGVLISITHADEPDENITNNTSNLSAEWVVDFTASPFEGYPPLCVQFTVSGPNGEYVWDFGDGTT